MALSNEKGFIANIVAEEIASGNDPMQQRATKWLGLTLQLLVNAVTGKVHLRSEAQAFNHVTQMEDEPTANAPNR
jgi:hypothetical protein